ncbi:hypothetical protein GCM10010129_11670 [Streptomyces fumigatiscleroticus]|nr:hypothetical protein GCM10010129_11670 [Streptomyces fumigatiscleroticus]
MAAEHESRAGADALMAAITGEPLPPGAREDAAVLAEHRAAVADVALLREQLGLIGRALGEPLEVAPAASAAPAAQAAHGTAVPVRRTRPRRRFLTLALGTLAVACAGAVVSGMAWLVVQGGGADDSAASGAQADSGAKEAATAFGSPRYLACARLVAEGTVTAVEPVPGTVRYRITLRVIRSYQPERGQKQVSFVVEEGVHPRLREGDRVLVGLEREEAQPDAVYVGEEEIAPERAWITASLPESRTLTCS